MIIHQSKAMQRWWIIVLHTCIYTGEYDYDMGLQAYIPGHISHIGIFFAQVNKVRVRCAGSHFCRHIAFCRGVSSRCTHPQLQYVYGTEWDKEI